MNHTPGPWTAPSAGVWTEDGIMVASCGSAEIIRTMRKAGRDPMRDVTGNVHLIAAAPDMAEALRDILHWMQNPKKALVGDLFEKAANSLLKAGVTLKEIT